MRLNELHDAYADKIDLVLIYVREAHPSDGWQTPQNLYADVVYETPTSDDERAEIAHACQIDLDLKYPMLLDRIDDKVDLAYGAKPMRLYVIDADGKVTYNGAPGPFGFDPDAWEEKLKEQIGASA